ncbi:hypothetical protein Gotri_023585 [Gossypium trilobum]|uniref:F-box domain-containing protein n=1 Tax=Gossypium trilobum TaxID=34281 RepID=A0A7J9DJX7_9ROSI|nr:hypothetical protein [Gossypium trilobum]
MASYDFSDEILFEIFSRAELKTMKKCRVLSKEWKDLTYESSFMRLHSERTSTMVGYLVQCSRIFDPLPSEVVPRKRRFVNSGKSFVNQLLNNGKSSRLQNLDLEDKYKHVGAQIEPFTVQNCPTLRQQVRRCRPRIRYDAVDLVSDSDSESEYSDEEDVSWHCEIFDSKSWEWKQSDDLNLTYYDSFKNTQDVSACGGLHWLMFNHEQDKYTILSFEGDKEERGMTSLPDSLGEKIVRVRSPMCHTKGNSG